MPAFLSDWHAAPRRTRATWLALSFLVFLGVFLRTLGYFGGENGLWNDEANWVLRIVNGRTGGSIRPPGYMWLSQAIISWHPSEAALRSLSYVTGVLSLPLFVLLATRAGLTRTATLLGLFVLAVHPWAVDYAKEFKPYGVELGFHVALLAVFFLYAQTHSWRHFLILGALGLVSLLFAWNTLFLLPFLALGVLLVQIQQKLKTQLKLTGSLLALGTLAILSIHGARILRLFSSKRGVGEKFWGQKYGVFYLDRNDISGKLEWMWQQTVELAQLPGQLHAAWDPSGKVSAAAGILFALLTFTGILLLLLQRRWTLLLLWFGPWALTMVANWRGFWPYGVFRTNPYLIIYALCLALWTVSSLQTWLRRWPRAELSWAALLAGGALLFLPTDLHYFTYKKVETGAFATSIGPSIETIVAYESERRAGGKPLPKASLFLDGYACGTYNYYVTQHPRTKQHSAFLKTNVTRRCTDNSIAKLKKLIKSKRNREFWLITARPAAAELIRPFIHKHCRHIDVEAKLPTPDTLFHCTAPPALAQSN